MRAWKIIAERMWRPRKGRPIVITLPKVATLGDVLVAQARIVEAMSDGQISPDEASLMSTVMDDQRKAIETTELAEEIERIKDIGGYAGNHQGRAAWKRANTQRYRTGACRSPGHQCRR
jgi:hypothetical protein